MIEPQDLLRRLDAIGESLSKMSGARALIGLGSVGLELERLDAWSDLDFFVIVENGMKSLFLENLDWLECICPVGYAFQNTPDGYKLLFADGIFCEFAIFEPREIHAIPYSPGRVIWKKTPGDIAFATPALKNRVAEPSSPQWLLGEALTNLLVGLMRLQRGEKLSAARFIQQYAVDRVVDLACHLEQAQPIAQDSFSPERRIEMRYPVLAQQFSFFIQGYEHSRQSALAILAFLQAHFEVNAVVAARIEQLAA